MPVHRTGHYPSGNRGRSGRQAGLAEFTALADILRPAVPEGLTGRQVQRIHAGIGLARPARAAVEIGHRHIQHVAIRGHAKMHAALNAAAADLAVPNDGTTLIRIQGIDVARLLPANYQVFPGRCRGQNRGRTEIVIRSVFRRAVDSLLRLAAHVPGIARRHLTLPDDMPVFD